MKPIFRKSFTLRPDKLCRGAYYDYKGKHCAIGQYLQACGVDDKSMCGPSFLQVVGLDSTFLPDVYRIQRVNDKCYGHRRLNMLRKEFAKPGIRMRPPRKASKS